MVKSKQVSKEEALIRLTSVCSRSEKCLFDVKKKLAEWNLSDEYDEIKAYLIDEKYIDENRYAVSFVNDKVKFSKWGFTKVKYHLRAKGIMEGAIEEGICQYSTAEYKQMMAKELEKKAGSLKETDAYKRKQKLYAFAAQRGYENEFVGSLIDSLL